MMERGGPLTMGEMRIEASPADSAVSRIESPALPRTGYLAIPGHRINPGRAWTGVEKAR